LSRLQCHWRRALPDRHISGIEMRFEAGLTQSAAGLYQSGIVYQA
jgi:hypothetical protein